jgi:tRNA(Ser,Leu) C12 N-acetylase TAN1
VSQQGEDMETSKTTRVVLTIDNELRNQVKEEARKRGKVLSAFYIELFKKGHALTLEESV